MFGLTQKFKDPLYRNSIFLITSLFLNAVTGFIFWVIATRLYSAEDVGLASAIISAAMLLHLFSLMGFEFSLAHYIPSSDHKYRCELIIMSFIVVSILSILLTFIFLLSLNIYNWSQALTNIMKKDIYICLFFTLFTTTISLTALQTLGIFVGFRKTEYSFVQNAISSISKVMILPFLTSFGVYGIFMSVTLSTFLAFIVGLILTLKLISLYNIKHMKLRIKQARSVIHFSLGNYFGKILELLPEYCLPLIITNVLGAEENAYFYIAWMLSSILFMIPRLVSHLLLAECSYNPKKIKDYSIEALKFSNIMSLPIIIGVFIFGEHILLLFFGEEYARKSFEILLILCISNIPFSFNATYLAIKRVKEEVGKVITIYGFIAFFTLLASQYLLQRFGLFGAGIAWILAQSIVAIYSLVFIIFKS